MKNLEITRAIQYLVPNAEFYIVGDSYEGINWQDNRPLPSEEELEAAFQELTEAGIDPLKGENWRRLQDDLRGTPLFAKAIQTSNTNAFSLLLSTLAVTHNKQDLEFAFSLVRAGLTEDYTVDEVAQINNLLTKNSIKLTIK